MIDSSLALNIALITYGNALLRKRDHFSELDESIHPSFKVVKRLQFDHDGLGDRVIEGPMSWFEWHQDTGTDGLVFAWNRSCGNSKESDNACWWIEAHSLNGSGLWIPEWIINPEYLEIDREARWKVTYHGSDVKLDPSIYSLHFEYRDAGISMLNKSSGQLREALKLALDFTHVVEGYTLEVQQRLKDAIDCLNESEPGCALIPKWCYGDESRRALNSCLNAYVLGNEELWSDQSLIADGDRKIFASVSVSLYEAIMQTVEWAVHPSLV